MPSAQWMRTSCYRLQQKQQNVLGLHRSFFFLLFIPQNIPLLLSADYTEFNGLPFPCRERHGPFHRLQCQNSWRSNCPTRGRSDEQSRPVFRCGLFQSLGPASSSPSFPYLPPRVAVSIHEAALSRGVKPADEAALSRGISSAEVSELIKTQLDVAQITKNPIWIPAVNWEGVDVRDHWKGLPGEVCDTL